MQQTELDSLLMVTLAKEAGGPLISQPPTLSNTCAHTAQEGISNQGAQPLGILHWGRGGSIARGQDIHQANIPTSSFSHFGLTQC